MGALCSTNSLGSESSPGGTNNSDTISFNFKITRVPRFDDFFNAAKVMFDQAECLRLSLENPR